MTTAADRPAGDRGPDEDTRHYADRLAALLDAGGVPRMPSRALMALLTSPAGELTADQIGEILEVSPAAVSGAIRYLQSMGLVRVGSLPGTRRRLYRLAPHWYTATLTRMSLYRELSELSRHRPPALAEGTPAGERLTEMDDFYAFLHRRFADLLREWNESRGASGQPPD